MLDALDATIGYSVGAFHRAARKIFVEKLTFGQWNIFAGRVKHGTGKLLRGVGIVYALECNQQSSLVHAHAAKTHDARGAVCFTAQLGAR